MPSPGSYVRVHTLAGPRHARLDGHVYRLLDRAPWLGGTDTDERVPAPGARLLCPVTPRTIFGIGKNYGAHAREMGGEVPAEPLVFLKTVTSLAGPGDTVRLPRESVRVDYEAELGVVIGSGGRRIPRSRAMSHVFGLVPLCDVTARDLQARDGQWARAKGFDTFCPVGPAVTTGLEPGGRTVRLVHNGIERQCASTSDMVFDVARLVEHLSGFATLEPGDLIATGTPEGIGPLAAGDRVVVAIDGLGSLQFGVAAEQ